METMRLDEELAKQKVQQQKHCNYNRHSKDSGVVDIELIKPSDNNHRASSVSNNNNNNGGTASVVASSSSVNVSQRECFFLQCSSYRKDYIMLLLV